MTLQEFRNLLLTADPTASHYESVKNTNYTVWKEFERRKTPEEEWRIQVDRFTKIEYDPIVELIDTALSTDDISFDYKVDYEENTGYIHHIWDCTVA
ncbi:MAG TPA: hypothetical protein DEF42_03680 [Desulfosporosinus sp.]|nr:hypothetical protein [Desulfosporosinus sp.]